MELLIKIKLWWQSRNSMEPVEFAFIDKVEGVEIWYYIDCFDVMWAANKGFRWWDFRVLAEKKS